MRERSTGLRRMGVGLGSRDQVVVPSGQVVGGRYVIEDLLARGGMAYVYRGRDVPTNHPVAIKVLRTDAADAHRFGIESRLLARLDHPNLVRLLDAGHDGRDPYLVMDLVEGPTLADRLEHGPLGAAEAWRIGRDIAEALAYVHGQGVIHRDVKPSNILLAHDGRALLADFGVARLTDGARVTSAPATIGTAAFMAPEQIGGAGVTPAADVYALGLVLLEALTGRPAFTGTQQELLVARMTREPQIPLDLPAPWPVLLRAMTRRNPGARPTAATVTARIAASPATANDSGLDTAEADVVALVGEIDEMDEPAQTATLPASDPTMSQPLHRAPAEEPARWWIACLLGGLAALAVIAAIAVAPIGGGQGGDTPASQESAASRPTSSTTTSTTVPSSATTSTTTTTVSTTAPAASSVQSQTPPAVTCADLEARRRAIEAEKQQVEQTYRDDPRTRERLKRQLQDEKQALDAQRRALGC
jgi:serine/threonine protein kinase